MERVKVVNLVQRFGLLMIIVIMVAGMSIVSPVFFTAGNIVNVIRQISINGILATGMTFVILTGGIDLSIGSLMAVTGVITGSLLVDGYPTFVAILAGVAASVAFGFFNGVLIAYCNLPPFIATLASTTIGRGFALVYSDGKPYTLTTPEFLAIGKGTSLGVPNPIWLLLVVVILASIILNISKFGRYVYAVGGNENATKLSGVKTRMVKMFAYVITGLLAGVAAVVLAARISSGQPTAGDGYELDAIAAVAIGGTSMSGGIGRLSGTVMGFVIIGLLSNSLTLLNVSSFYQQIVKGFIIIIAVLIDQRTKGKSN